MFSIDRPVDNDIGLAISKDGPTYHVVKSVR